MADYSAIRDQIAVRLRTVSAFAVVFDTTPDRVTVPCAIVRPGSPVADYHEAMGGQGLTRFNFEVLALAQRWEPNAGQDVLDGFISGSAGVEPGGTVTDGDLEGCNIDALISAGHLAAPPTTKKEG